MDELVDFLEPVRGVRRRGGRQKRRTQPNSCARHPAASSSRPVASPSLACPPAPSQSPTSPKFMREMQPLCFTQVSCGSASSDLVPRHQPSPRQNRRSLPVSR
eukprot:768636-Hanusia_phi.AAC.6